MASSWGTTPSSRRAGIGERCTSWPSTLTLPPLGASRPLMQPIVVDLPAPLGPSRPKTSPAWAEKETPSTATVSP